jgi:hypothetical protein
MQRRHINLFKVDYPLEILEKKVGGNVGGEEEKKALDLAEKLAEI